MTEKSIEEMLRELIKRWKRYESEYSHPAEAATWEAARVELEEFLEEEKEVSNDDEGANDD